MLRKGYDLDHPMCLDTIILFCKNYGNYFRIG